MVCADSDQKGRRFLLCRLRRLHMRHAGNKQGLYREKKIAQLGQAGYDALQKRAYSLVKRSEAIATCMALLT